MHHPISYLHFSPGITVMYDANSVRWLRGLALRLLNLSNDVHNVLLRVRRR